MYTLKLVEAHKGPNTFGHIHVTLWLPDADSLACISTRVRTLFSSNLVSPLCLLVLYICELNHIGQTNYYGSRKQMETISYPCSPLLFFPTHEESSYSLWSPPLTLHENAAIPADPSPDVREDCEFFDTIAIDSSDSHDQHAFDVDVFTHCDERFLCQESANLAAIQDELMEENSLSDLLLTGQMRLRLGIQALPWQCFQNFMASWLAPVRMLQPALSVAWPTTLPKACNPGYLVHALHATCQIQCSLVSCRRTR